MLTSFFTFSRAGIAAGIDLAGLFVVLSADRLPKLLTLLVAGAGRRAPLPRCANSRDALARRPGQLDRPTQQGDQVLLFTLLVCVVVGADPGRRSSAAMRRGPAAAAGSRSPATAVGHRAGDRRRLRAGRRWSPSTPRAAPPTPGTNSRQEESPARAAAGSSASPVRTGTQLLESSALDENATKPLDRDRLGHLRILVGARRRHRRRRPRHPLPLVPDPRRGRDHRLRPATRLPRRRSWSAAAAKSSAPTPRTAAAGGRAGRVSSRSFSPRPSTGCGRSRCSPVVDAPAGVDPRHRRSRRPPREEPAPLGWPAAGRRSRSVALVAIVVIAIPLASTTPPARERSRRPRRRPAGRARCARSAQNVEPGAPTPRLQQALILEELGDLDQAAEAARGATERERHQLAQLADPLADRSPARRGRRMRCAPTRRHARSTPNLRIFNQ